LNGYLSGPGFAPWRRPPSFSRVWPIFHSSWVRHRLATTIGRKDPIELIFWLVFKKALHRLVLTSAALEF
jgi:hypothetical protein